MSERSNQIHTTYRRVNLHPYRLTALLPLLWAALVATGLFALLSHRGFDDPYITYRYAANLAAGHGFVYNIGERVLSTTTPLYTLLLVFPAWLGLDLPLVSNATSCVSLALGGLAFWQLGKVWRTPLVGLTGLLLYPAFPLLLTTLGAETSFCMALTLWAFVACAQRRYRMAAALFALATLTRADGVVAAGVGGIYVLFQNIHNGSSFSSFILHPSPFIRSLPWSALLVYLALLAPWFLFAWLYFGSPLPVTLAAKQQQGLMVISPCFWEGLVRQVQNNYWPNPFYRVWFVLAGLGLLYGLWRERHWLLLPGWALAYGVGYQTLAVSGYFWYYAALVVGFIPLVGLGVLVLYQALARLLQRFSGQRFVDAFTALLLVLLLYPQLGALAFFSQTNDSRMAIYRDVGLWLHNNTAPDASVGTLEVGIIGYYSQRRMIDFAGLIQPSVARQLLPTSSYEDSAIWAVAQYQPDYLVLQKILLPIALRNQDIFCKERYFLPQLYLLQCR